MILIVVVVSMMNFEKPLLAERLITHRRLSEVVLLLIRSLVHSKLTASDLIIAVLISSLIKSNQTIMIEQLIMSRVIPVSAAVSCTLLSDRATLQLGLDMLKRGGGNQSQISEVLLANDELLEALRHCPTDPPQNDVTSFVTKKYLEKALQLDEELFKLLVHKMTNATKVTHRVSPRRSSSLPYVELGPNDHWNDAPHFII